MKIDALGEHRRAPLSRFSGQPQDVEVLLVSTTANCNLRLTLECRCAVSRGTSGTRVNHDCRVEISREILKPGSEIRGVSDHTPDQMVGSLNAAGKGRARCNADSNREWHLLGCFRCGDE